MKRLRRQNMLSPVGWLALSVLIAFIDVAMWCSVKVWTAMSGVQMSGFGRASLALGVVFTIGLGVGQMGLVFYSSRHDIDR
jgi:hypothetical protein